MKKLVAAFVLFFAMMSWAQASVITLTNFQLIWYEETTQLGGLAKFVDLDEQINPFQVMVANFEDSFNNEGSGLKGFITPLFGSGVSFDRIDLYSVSGKLHEQLETSIGYGFTDNGEALFADRVSFLEINGASFTVTTNSDIPEPASVFTMLVGLALLLVIRKRSAKTWQQET